MAEDAPDPVEVNDFRFVQLRKFHLFNEEDGSCLTEAINLIAASSRFGLLFIGINEGFKILKLENILDLDEDKEKSRQVVENYVCHTVKTPTAPILLALSSDDMTLSVCAVRNDQCVADMYDIRAFADPSTAPAPFLTVQLSSHPTELKDFMWNPVVVEMYAYCLADGSAHVHEVSETNLKICASLPAQTGATAVCWSPKGKQLVIGKKDGSFSQYKPNLQEVKKIPAPQLEDGNVEVLNMHWLSTTQFAVVYLPNGGDTPSLAIVSTPKGASPTYINFGDICLGSSSGRKSRYLMHHQPEWNMLISASANAVETSVIGYSNDEKSIWKPWALEGGGRAELPMMKYKETYPLGMGVMFCAQRKVIVSETESHPPMPVFFILSTCGLLCPFHMLNTFPGIANIVYPSEPISRDGERKPKEGTNLLVGTTRQSGPTQIQPIQMQQMTPSSPPNLQKPSSGPVFPSFQVSTPSLQKQSPIAMKSNTSLPPFSSISFQQTPQNVVVQPGATLFVPVVTQAVVQNSAPFQPFTNPPKQPGTFLPGQQPAFMNRDISGAAPQNLVAPTSIVQQSLSPSKTDEMPNAMVKKNDLILSRPLQEIQSRDSPPKPSRIEEVAEDVEQEACLLAVSVEIQKFELEIQKLKNLSMNSRVSIGTKEEMADIKRKTLLLTDFQKDMSETMMSLGMDIQTLKTASLECFAMIGDANSKNQRRNDPTYICMLKDRVLDPVTAKRMQKIQQLYQYIGTQLQELHRKMDQDYLEIVEWKKEVKKISQRIPSTQAIYQTIVNNQNVIHNLQGRLNNLTEKFQSVKLNNLARNRLLLSSNENIGSENDLGKLADVLLQDKSPNASAHNISQIQPERKKLSASIQSVLRDALMNHKVTCVRPTVISDPSQSRLLSTSVLRNRKKSGEIHKVIEGGGDACKLPVFSAVTKIPEKQSKDLAVGLRPVSAFTSKSVLQTAAGITQGVPVSGYVTKPKQVPVMQVINKNMENQKESSVAFTELGSYSSTVHPLVYRMQPISNSEGKVPTLPMGTSIISNAWPQQEYLQHSPELKSAITSEALRTDGMKQVSSTSFFQPQKSAVYEDITPPSTPAVPSILTISSSQTGGQVMIMGKELMDSIKQQNSPTSAFTFSSPFMPGDSSNTMPKDTEPSGEVFVISTEGGKPVTVRLQPSADENKENASVTPNESILPSRSPFSMKAPFSNQSVFSQPTAHLFSSSASDKQNITSEKVKQLSSKENILTASLESVKNDAPKDVPKGFMVTSPIMQAPSKTSFALTPESRNRETSFVQAVTSSSSSQSSNSTLGASQFNVLSSPVSAQETGDASSFFSTQKTVPNSFFGSLPSVSSTSATTSSFFNRPTDGTQSSIFGKTGLVFTEASSGTTMTTGRPIPSSQSNLTSQTEASVKEQVSILSPKRTTQTSAPEVISSGAQLLSSTSPSLSKGTVATSTRSVVSSSSNTEDSVTNSTFSQLSMNLSNFGQGETTVASSLFAKPSSAAVAITTVNKTTTTTPTLFGETAPASTTFEKVDAARDIPEKNKQDTPDSSTLAHVSSTTPSSPSDQAPITSSSSLFGQPVTTSAATTTVSSQFGQAAATTTVASPFGQTAATTTAFGQVSLATTDSSPFGQSATTTAGSNLFGQQPQQTSAFGLTATTSASSSFGSPTSVFGQAGSTAPAFGQTTTTASNVFNQSGFFDSANTQSAFGQKDQNSSSPFGGGQTSSAFGFGQNQSGGSFGLTKAVFGQPQGTTSPFGQSSDQSGGFGLSSFFGGLGGKPSEQNASKNVFGSITASGGGTSPNMFGNQGALTFGTKPAAGFAGGNFSNPGGSVAQSGFGAFQQTPQKSGFGGAPSFGSSPTFGGSPAFGSPPAFGSSPVQPTNVASSTSPFGSAQATFSNFANNSFPSFGALASQQPPSFGQQQQTEQPLFGGGSSLFGGSSPPSFGVQQPQQQQQQQPPTGFGSPSNTGGSSAFTQWRN